MTCHIQPSSGMKDNELYIYGASGHGKVVIENALALDYHVNGLIDDNALLTDKCVLGIRVAGTFEWLARRARQSKVVVALGIGDNTARCFVAERCRRLEIPLITLIHPSATISPSATIGDGTVVMAQVAVNANAEIGYGVIVNSGAIVEHDCKVGDYVHLSPRSSIGGASMIGKMSWLGMGATIIQGISVGVGSVVGAGAVVISDLPDSVVAVGVPARICHRASCVKE